MVMRRRHESSGASQGERPHCGTAAGRGWPLSRPRPPLSPCEALSPPARWHCAERRVVAVHVALRHLAPGSEREAQETAAHPAALAVSSAQQLRGGGARGRRRHLPSANPLSFPREGESAAREAAAAALLPTPPLPPPPPPPPFSQQALRRAQAAFTLLAKKAHPAAPCCHGRALVHECEPAALGRPLARVAAREGAAARTPRARHTHSGARRAADGALADPASRMLPAVGGGRVAGSEGRGHRGAVRVAARRLPPPQALHGGVEPEVAALPGPWGRRPARRGTIPTARRPNP